MTQWQKKVKNDVRILLLHEWRPVYRGHNGDRLFARRVRKSDAAGMEVDAAIPVAARGAVLQIALDGAAYARKLTADLMMTAREKFHLNQGITVKLTQRAIPQAGLLCLRIAVFTYV